MDLYITGFNAFLLSSELSILLSGRYVEIKMLPLSFKEYVSAFDSQNYNLLYRNYLENSSFPGALVYDRKKDIRMYLDGIYNTIFVKDIAIRKNVNNSSKLLSLMEFIFDNIGNLCSLRSILNNMFSHGQQSVFLQ